MPALSSLGLGSPHTLQVTLENTLLAGSTTGGLRFIEKKYVGFPGDGGTCCGSRTGKLALLLAGVMAAPCWSGVGECESPSRAGTCEQFV